MRPFAADIRCGYSVRKFVGPSATAFGLSRFYQDEGGYSDGRAEIGLVPQMVGLGFRMARMDCFKAHLDKMLFVSTVSHILYIHTECSVLAPWFEDDW